MEELRNSPCEEIQESFWKLHCAPYEPVKGFVDGSDSHRQALVRRNFNAGTSMVEMQCVGFVLRRSELSGVDRDMVAAAALSSDRGAAAETPGETTGPRLCTLLGRLSSFRKEFRACPQPPLTHTSGVPVRGSAGASS